MNNGRLTIQNGGLTIKSGDLTSMGMDIMGYTANDMAFFGVSENGLSP